MSRIAPGRRRSIGSRKPARLAFADRALYLGDPAFVPCRWRA